MKVLFLGKNMHAGCYKLNGTFNSKATVLYVHKRPFLQRVTIMNVHSSIYPAQAAKDQHMLQHLAPESL